MNKITERSLPQSVDLVNPVNPVCLLYLVSMRWPAYMNVRSRSCTWDGLAKREKRDAIGTQETEQGLSFRAIRMQ